MHPGKVLREILRHYLEFRDFVANGGDHVIEYSYLVPDDDGHHKETISFSFWDLHRGISELAPRKREALYWNVICDLRQCDVAERMGITTVSVGQYVINAVSQLSAQHFPTLPEPEDDGAS
jgi:DNA-directed RNA polymerase specialized sigma24 family protein